MWVLEFDCIMWVLDVLYMNIRCALREYSVCIVWILGV